MDCFNKFGFQLRKDLMVEHLKKGMSKEDGKVMAALFSALKISLHVRSLV